jgi:hypothetical protein
MLQLLRSKLEANVKRLDSLQVDATEVSSEVSAAAAAKDGERLLVMAEAQRDMFHLELKNMKVKLGSSQADTMACSVINDQIETCEERNLASALISMEKAMVQSDEAIIHNIEISAEAIENIIPALEAKVYDRKAEMSASHDSSKLLTSAVEVNYRTMRDGYLELLRKVFAEASIQWKSLLCLQEPNTKWHLQKLNQVIQDARDSPQLAEKREQIYATAQQQLDRYCAHSFEKIQSSTMYEEKEQFLQQIETIRRQVFAHKARVVQERETLINSAEAQLDNVYMDSVEELNEHLFELQDFLHQLVFYERRLTQLLVVTFRRELKMDRLGRSVADAHPGATPQSSSSGASLYSADSEKIVALGQQTLQDLHAPFRMGTVLRSLAESCDLSAEETEKLLNYVLFQESGPIVAEN